MDTFKTYGSPNPRFRIVYTGFINNDGIHSISAPAAQSTANQKSNVGVYPILLKGGSSANYNFEFQNGNLKIIPAMLNIRADDKMIYEGDPLPYFTVTADGFLNNDGPLMVGPKKWKVDPEYKGLPGIYTITPSAIPLAYQNYEYVFHSGRLYVNPKGKKSQKILASLVCVSPVSNRADGLKYVARFENHNRNYTTIYIPAGPDNRLVGQGRFAGTVPESFNPGKGSFEIYFDGSKMYWELKSFENKHKSAVVSNASSQSGKCNAGRKPGSSAMDTEAAETELQSESDNIGVNPNPVRTRTMIQWKEPAASNATVQLMDLNGKLQQGFSFRFMNKNQGELEMSQIPAGVYFLEIRSDRKRYVVRILKL